MPGAINASGKAAAEPRRHLHAQTHYYLALAFAIVIGGFWPSFFRRLGSTDAAHLVHGVSATLWMMVPIAQSWLVSRRELAWHRRFGRASLVLVPVMVVSGLHMVRVMLLDQDSIAEPLRLKFAFLDTSAMLFFVAAIGLALRSIHRRDIVRHSQYMLCTVLVVLEPAVERLLVHTVPGVNGYDLALQLALVIMELVTAIVILKQLRRGRSAYSPYALTLGFFVAVHILLEILPPSRGFRAAAQWFAGL